MLGYTQPTGARRLGTSPRSVRRAVTSAVSRLGACSPTHAVALAVVLRQLDPDARELPAWPDEAAEGRRSWRRSVEAADRRARFARMLARDVPIEVAAARLRVTVSTARRYQQRLLAEAVAAEE